MDIGLPELLIILAIVVIIFGAGRLARLGGELGEGIRAFRQGLSGPEQEVKSAPVSKEDQDRPQGDPS